MTIKEYLGASKEPEFFTVEELYETLQQMVDNGMGNHIVLVSNNYNTDIEADYRFLDKSNSFTLSDTYDKCVYLETFTDTTEEELAYALEEALNS